jgi:hypothetical protein
MHQSTVQDQVQQSFDRFRGDYAVAEQAYLMSGSTSAAQASFSAFTTQRVYQLSQELSGSLGRVAAVAKKGQTASSLRQFLNSRILSPQPSGGLLGGLRASTAPVGTTAATASLYTLAADSAINAAETASLNAIRSLRSGLFTGNQHIYGK